MIEHSGLEFTECPGVWRSVTDFVSAFPAGEIEFRGGDQDDGHHQSGFALERGTVRAQVVVVAEHGEDRHGVSARRWLGAGVGHLAISN